MSMSQFMVRSGIKDACIKNITVIKHNLHITYTPSCKKLFQRLSIHHQSVP
jgi:hypothetical protein